MFMKERPFLGGFEVVFSRKNMLTFKIHANFDKYNNLHPPWKKINILADVQSDFH